MVMMIKALIWEVAFKNRVQLIGVLLVVPLVWIFSESYLDETIGEYVSIGKISFAIMLISVLFLYLTFSYVDADSKEKLNEGFPSHLLRMPIHTWLLPIVPVLLATIVVSVYIILWISYFSEWEVSTLLQLLIFCATGALISWSQAVNWGLNTSLIQKVVLLLTVITGLMFSVVVVFEIYQPATFLAKVYSSLGLISLLISGYYLCFLTLAKTRRNENFPLRLNSSAVQRLKLFFANAPLPEFSTGLHAQYWYEWKMLAFAIPLTIGLIAIIEVGTAILEAESKMIFTAAIMMVTVFLMSSHLIACNKLGGDKFNILQHNATRPLSDFDLAMSKLHPLAVSIFLSYLLFIFAPLVSCYIIGFPELSVAASEDHLIEKMDGYSMLSLFSLALISFLAVFWIVSANGCAILLRDSKLMFYINVLVFLCLAIGLLSLFVYLKDQQQGFDAALQETYIFQIIVDYPQMIPLTFTATILLLLGSLVRPFKRVARINQLTKYAVICAIGLIVGLGMLWSANLPLKTSAFTSYSLVNLFLLCFLPFVLAPISVAKNRHR